MGEMEIGMTGMTMGNDGTMFCFAGTYGGEDILNAMEKVHSEGNKPIEIHVDVYAYTQLVRLPPYFDDKIYGLPILKKKEPDEIKGKATMIYEIVEEYEDAPFRVLHFRGVE